jgi:hypothetical protein
VVVYDSSLEHQHSSLRKFSKRWFGLYIVWKVHDNDTYQLQELDDTMIKNLIAGKRVKVFRKRQDTGPIPECMTGLSEDHLLKDPG